MGTTAPDLDLPLEVRFDPRAALGLWLEQWPWDAWGTFTFDARFGEDGPSLYRGAHHFEKWARHLPHRPGYFYAVERGSRGGRTHVHALLQRGHWPSGVPRLATWRSWFHRFGRCEILPYGFDRRGEPVSGAEFYLTKYLTKAPLTWDLDRLIMG